MINLSEQQDKKVTGKITDLNGASLPGVSVVVKGTTTGITSDNDGNFSLVLPNDAKTLLFSFIGMKTQEIEIGTKLTFNVTLVDETIGLEEVVAIGYGTSKKGDLSAAVAVIKDMDKLKDRPVLSTASMIQGLVPGVTVVNQGGQPGASPSVTIRGTGSKSESVLYVVDGVPDAPYNPGAVSYTHLTLPT